MGQALTPSPAPPFCSECATKTQPIGGAPPAQSASRMWRSADGKFRLDTPSTSVITDPASQQTILLDHVKKEATIVPVSSAASGTALPGGPQLSAVQGQAPQVHVEDLGKSMIEGHEVEGKRFTLPPFTPPAKPAMPAASIPKPPQASIPGAPGLPAVPKIPTLPHVPSVTEVWTSVKLKAPVLTKVTTSAGEQTTYCKPVSGDEPHPSVFQIPQGYKIKPPKI